MSHELSNLAPVPGSRRRHFRVGRGIGSGNGKTAGRGTKGQNSRSGANLTPGFEGGQMPIQRRLPKRGFRNIHAIPVETVNVSELERIVGVSVVDVEVMKQYGLVTGKHKVKVLGDGELTKAFTVRASSFSAGATAKIEACGGKVEVA